MQDYILGGYDYPKEDDFRNYDFQPPRPLLGQQDYAPEPEQSWADKLVRATPNTYTEQIPQEDRKRHLWEALMMAGLKTMATGGQPYAGPARPAWSAALSTAGQIPLDTAANYKELTDRDVLQLKGRAEEQNKYLAAMASQRSAEGNYLRGQGTMMQGQAALNRPEPMNWFAGYDKNGKLTQHGVGARTPAYSTGVGVETRPVGGANSGAVDKRADIKDARANVAKAYEAIKGVRVDNIKSAQNILADYKAGKWTQEMDVRVRDFVTQADAMENSPDANIRGAYKLSTLKEIHKAYKAGLAELDANKGTSTHTGGRNIGAGK